jgi:hypothetical protein
VTATYADPAAQAVCPTSWAGRQTLATNPQHKEHSIVSTLVPRSLAAAGLTAILTATAVTAPAAYAGGGGQIYVYGDTLSECRTNLSATIKLYRANDYTVTGIQACRKTGDGTRYFGDFVAS